MGLRPHRSQTRSPCGAIATLCSDWHGHGRLALLGPCRGQHRSFCPGCPTELSSLLIWMIHRRTLAKRSSHHLGRERSASQSHHRWTARTPPRWTESADPQRREHLIVFPPLRKVRCGYQQSNRSRHSSRSSINGLTDSARCAGIQVPSNPRSAIATTTPASTTGSRGLA